MPTEPETQGRPESTAAREQRLIAALAEFYDRAAAGEPPDRDEFLARHPDLADDLARHLDAEADLRDLAAPLRWAAPVGDLETLSHAASNPRGDATATVTVGGDTGPEAEDSPPALVRYFGDYEILRVLGRGGMGVVYEARQVSLDRPVALKLIRSGILADPADLRRFEIEAEAAAALDHPNIVPVYEVGEHEGQRFFSMKRIEGRSLADQIDRFRGEPRKAARVLITAARAVQHAHMRGVLHRDLKPSNLLLDAEGNPHVADFGLAKRLDGRGATDETHTGAILGTPSFMSPEQAEGRTRGITTAADVYGLGAILYAMLSGRLPFQGESTAETLRKVREDRPEPLARINPRVPRDLAIIAEKCLEKDPKRRYEAAAALAEDLERWVKGEPIQARAVGRAERLWLWCRRNPTVASLTGGVAASLLIGIASSTYFGLNERRERRRAERAEQTMEGHLARGLGRALDTEGNGNKFLSTAEAESLWELARLGNTNVGHRFLDEATKDPIALTQLYSRSEPALIAAVGLDAERHDRAVQLLLDRMNEPKRSPNERGEIAFVALELVDGPGPLSAACTRAILDALDADTQGQFRDGLSSDRVTARMQPGEAARVLGDVLARETHSWVRQSLAEGLSAAAGRMDPVEASRVCVEASRVLRDALAQEANARARQFLAEGLSAVARRMDPVEASRVCVEASRVLGDALARETDGWARLNLAQGLSAVSGRMDPVEASRVCGEASRVLRDALAREPDGQARLNLAQGLSAVSARMDPVESSRVCGEASRVLREALARETGAMPAACSRPVDCAGRMEPREASRVLGDAARPGDRRVGALNLAQDCRRCRGGWIPSRRRGCAARRRGCCATRWRGSPTGRRD
ncbi:MAG: serine/threonine-protein kinase [Isosphaeraceae bacterium]